MNAHLPCPQSPPRPALRYLGGKWRLAPWIIGHFPPHRIYVEPFAGGASVLLRKRRAYAEIYNDLDGEVSNLFRVLRDPKLSAQLVEAIRLTPFSREEFDLAAKAARSRVERARRLVARSFMSHGSNAARADRTTGFRADSNNSGTSPARDWANFPESLAVVAERMRGVVVESRPALDIIRRFDGPDALIFADPPYVHSTRSKKRIKGELFHGYRHEMTDADHVELLQALREANGFVVLSGYPNPLYDELLADWRCVLCDAHADGALDRVEALWMNPRAAAALDLAALRPVQGDLI